MSVFQIAAWIITGIAVGTISSLLSTKSELRRLVRDYQAPPSVKDMALIAVPMFLFFIFCFSIGLSMLGSVERLMISQGLLFSVYFWGISIDITRVVLFAMFEKKEKMRIVQRWMGGGIALIPRPPNTSNPTETAVKKELPNSTGVKKV